MSKTIACVVLGLILAGVAAPGLRNAVAESRVQDQLEEARGAFRKHNYKPALRAYRAALAQTSRPLDQRAECFLQIGECLRRLKKWDDALAHLDISGDRPFFLGTIWEGRVLALRGQIALTMPHYYYKKGEIVSRTEWIQGATYFYTYVDDLRQGMKDLERAVKVFDQFSEQELKADAREKKRFVKEAVAAMTSMAEALEALAGQLGGLKGLEPSKEFLDDLAKHGIGAYGGNDPQAWYRRAEALCRRFDDMELAARCRHLEAMWARRLLDAVRVHEMRRNDGLIDVIVRLGGTNDAPILAEMPREKNVFELLPRLVKDYPEAKILDSSIYALVRICNEWGHYTKALKWIGEFRRRFSKSLWTSDIAAVEQEILYPRLSVSNPESVLPGEVVKVALKTRNLTQVTVSAHRIHLMDFLRSRAYLSNPKASLQKIPSLLTGRLHDRYVERRPVMTVSRATPDEGKHRYRDLVVELPLADQGAYLIDVVGGEVARRAMVVVSNLAAVRKLSGEESILQVVNALSGQPVSDAKVLIRQRHAARGVFGRYQKITYSWTESDGQGLARRPHESAKGKWIYIESVAVRGDSFAFCGFEETFDEKDEKASTVVYGFTDRPVYRPDQIVHFVGDLRRKRGTEFENLPDFTVQVKVRDPKNNVLFDEMLSTDETGSVSASIHLGEEPPLGRYRVEYRTGNRTIGSHVFAVEEYKKPEFEVTVEGPDEQFKLGADVPVTLRATYYYGAPVAGGKVQYRVFRQRLFPRFSRPDPYRWLYGRRKRSGLRRFPNPGQEMVFQGEGVLDERGRLVVSISTKAWAAKYPDQDHVFEVQADVTDLSRRTISGSGRVLAPRRALFVDVSVPKGFYRVGETVEATLQAETPQGAPQATTGRLDVFRIRSRLVKDELEEELIQIQSLDAKTAQNGIGHAAWTADSPGRFALRYTTQDKFGDPVVGEFRIWVHADGYRGGEVQVKNVELLTDKDEYKPGETAYLMLTSLFDEGSVLLTVEAGRKILSTTVVAVTGRTTVLALPITTAHAPNVFVHAVMVHGGRAYQAHREVFVPPVDRFLDVQMQFSKVEFRPGAEAVLEITSRDARGRPVAAEFAVSVFDKSITYIRADATPDIRKFFYGKRRTFYGGARWDSNLTVSLGFSFGGLRLHVPRWKKFRRHGLPPGWSIQFDPIQHLGKFMDASSTQLGFAANAPGAPSEAAEGSLDAGVAGGDLMDFDDAVVEAERKSPARKMARRGRLAEKDKRGYVGKEQRQASSGAAPEPVLRQNFSDSAFFAAAVRTGVDGKARITFTMPDSLTTWVAVARGLTKDTRVGEAKAETRTKKRVQARLQAPRFFTERDEILVSGLLRNDYDAPLQATVRLDLAGGAVAPRDELERTLEIPVGREVRVDWRLAVVDAGNAQMTLSVTTEREGDAMRMSFPVFPYGRNKIVTQMAHLGSGRQTASLLVNLPAERRGGELEIVLEPSIAGALLESLPYLVEYPYGCTEQTISRFLPAVFVSKTLDEMGISLDDIAEKRKDLLNREQLAGTRKLAPVYSSFEMKRIIQASLRRLSSMQNSDGGFGWWAADRSSLHMSCYAAYGLTEAKNADVKLPARMLDRCLDYIEREIRDNRSLPQLSYAAFVLARAGRPMTKLLDHVFENRDDLSNQSKAQLALALRASKRVAEARLVMENLRDFVQEDAENGTAHWAGGSSWWFWWNDPIETNAFVLWALTACDPTSPYAQPLARWIVNNRQGNRWKSTRDTAHAVYALTKFMKGGLELDPDYDVEIRFAGQTFRRHVDKNNMFAFDNRIVIRGDALADGASDLKIVKEGKGVLYVTSRVSYFSTEEKITGAGYEIFVNRRYEILTPYEKTVRRGEREVKVLDYRRQPIADLAQVPAGSLVEVILEVESKNNYEYIMVEDRKPSGFEPVQLRSGSRYANGLCSNMELRDEKVVFFVTWLQQGTHEIRYKMRAEIPGKIHAMPAFAQAMYAPRLSGISDSWTFQVIETGQ